MKKYLTVFGLSFQNEFTYRLNFILWRVRNVLRILMTFFLWNSIFSANKIAFGYTREQMIAYVFLVLVVSSFVMSAPSNDNVGGEIGNGDLSNYLVKPVGYLRYWLTRDWASKLLNGIFSVLEITLLWIFLRPILNLSSSPIILVIGIVSCILAAILFFIITKLAVSIAFWNPEDPWGLMFLIMVFMETIAGTIFPLSVLPSVIYNLLKFTPFPYMIYFPISILVGKFPIWESTQIIIIGLCWILGFGIILTKVWKKGLKTYATSGR